MRLFENIQCLIFLKCTFLDAGSRCLSVHVGEEFIAVSEETSHKEKPERKVDNSNLRTNVFQEQWCVVKNSERYGVSSVDRTGLSSESLDSSEVDHYAEVRYCGM